MDWTALLIGLGGLLLGGFTALLSYLQRKDERTSQYREAIFTKQIEASVEIINAVTEQLNNVRNLVDIEIEQDEMSIKIEEALEAYRKIRRVHDKWIIFISVEVHDAINSFNVNAREFLKSIPSFISDDSNKHNLEKYDKEVRVSYYVLVEEMRKMIGADPLTAESQKLIGSKSED